MKLAVNCQQAVFIDVGIDFRGGNIAVAEHLLDRPEIGAVFQKMSGETVPQRMRMDLFIYPGKESGLFDDRPEAFSVQPSAGTRNEQIR